MRYIVICGEEVFWSDSSLKGCQDFIKRTLKKHPLHSALKIYQEV